MNALVRRPRGEEGRAPFFADPKVHSKLYRDGTELRLGVSAMFNGRAFMASVPVIGRLEERTADLLKVADLFEAMAAEIRKGAA